MSQREKFEHDADEELRKQAMLMLDHPCLTNFLVELRRARQAGMAEGIKLMRKEVLALVMAEQALSRYRLNAVARRDACENIVAAIRSLTPEEVMKGM